MKKNRAPKLIFTSFAVFLFCISVFAQQPLAEIAKGSLESESDAVIVISGDQEIFRYLPMGESTLIETMSMTKSFASLAIGFLVDDKKIASIDVPLTRWFPEWKNSPKSEITLRHILNQTSGLEAKRDTSDIYPQNDFVKFALAAALKDKPGTTFFYNNKAVNLIAGIVKKASGIPIDQYLRRKLFIPLEIKNFVWEKDNAGNPHCMSGLRLSAADLSKVGRLLLNDGKWKGRQIISKRWIELSTTPSPQNSSLGLLWWLNYDSWVTKVTDEQLKIYSSAGLPKALISALTESQKIADFNFYQLRQSRKDLASALIQFDELRKQGKIPYPHQEPVGIPTGFSAEGSVGQQLVILRRKKIIGVRQRIKRNRSDEENDSIQFDGFLKLLTGL